jgi:hypothetical protein
MTLKTGQAFDSRSALEKEMTRRVVARGIIWQTLNSQQ